MCHASCFRGAAPTGTLARAIVDQGVVFTTLGVRVRVCFYSIKSEQAALRITKVCYCCLGDTGTNMKPAQHLNV